MKIGIIAHRSTVSEALKRALILRPEHAIVWMTRTTELALELGAKLRPDVILMELLPSAEEGVDATRRIMAKMPCAILLVTCGVSDRAAEHIFQAMGQGALDAVDVLITNGDWLAGAAEFGKKIDALAAFVASRQSVTAAGLFGGSTVMAMPPRLVAIGASAGGPNALAVILRKLPQAFAAAVVIVQHVDARFARSMAEWLGEHSRLPVRMAQENEIPEPGVVLLASTQGHLKFKRPDRLGYTVNLRDLTYRPCIDVFFESVSALWPGKAVGVLLTGMGCDGASGLQAMRRRGHHTLVQDPSASVAREMPQAALTLGAAIETLPVERIAERLIEFSDANAEPAAPITAAR